MLLLEFVIVAAGIFIGFQVDRWYEQIQDDAITEQYIQRLLTNVENDIANLASAANTAKSRREISQWHSSNVGPSVTTSVMRLETTSYL